VAETEKTMSATQTIENLLMAMPWMNAFYADSTPSDMNLSSF